MRTCSTIFIESHHCTNTGDCLTTGVCDGCNQCVDYSHLTICGSDEAEVVDEIAVVVPANGGGGGGGGDRGSKNN